MPAKIIIHARRLFTRVLFLNPYTCPECDHTDRSTNFDWRMRATTAPHRRMLKFVYCPKCAVDLSGSALTRHPVRR